jgi:hypothetical protein
MDHLNRVVPDTNHRAGTTGFVCVGGKKSKERGPNLPRGGNKDFFEKLMSKRFEKVF